MILNALCQSSSWTLGTLLLVKAVSLCQPTTYGSPWVANKVLRTLMVLIDEVEGTTTTSNYFEYASITIKNSLLWNGPAWSM